MVFTPCFNGQAAVSILKRAELTQKQVLRKNLEYNSWLLIIITTKILFLELQVLLSEMGV